MQKEFDEENYMQIEPFRYIYNAEAFTFSKCGLDIKRNFAHMKAESGYKYIKCPDKESITDLGSFLIERSPHKDVGVFFIHLNGDITLMLHDSTMGDDIERFYLEPKIGVNKDFYVLGDIAQGLDCYSLVVEVEHDIYKVIEE